MVMKLSFVTDTATLCVFDVASLRHRLADAADWWSIPEDEVAEVNMGNAAFLGLGRDGVYQVELVESLRTTNPIGLKIPSGNVFIGAGEEVTSDGLEPEGLRGGFIRLAPGTYELHAKFVGPSEIQIAFYKTSKLVANRFSRPIKLK
jgi:hypothetical protein